MDQINNNQAPMEEGISLTDLFKIIWANWTIVFLVTLWVAVIGILYTFVIVEPKYTAEATVSIEVEINETTTSDQSALSISQNLVNTVKAFAMTDLVLDAVIAEIPSLSNMTSAQLASKITISTVTSVPIIDISVEDESAILAQAIANKLIDKMVEKSDNYLLIKDRIKPIDYAKQPSVPSSPNKLLNIVISVLIGGILSLGIVFVKELFNNKFKSAEEMEKYLSINVIASVPGTVKERKLVD
jgi:capsular polysaccharide biosynthesis protein